MKTLILLILTIGLLIINGCSTTIGELREMNIKGLKNNSYGLAVCSESIEVKGNYQEIFRNIVRNIGFTGLEADKILYTDIKKGEIVISHTFGFTHIAGFYEIKFKDEKTTEINICATSTVALNRLILFLDTEWINKTFNN